MKNQPWIAGTAGSDDRADEGAGHCAEEEWQLLKIVSIDEEERHDAADQNDGQRGERPGRRPTGCCTVAAQGLVKDPDLLASLRVLPANYRGKRVDPTRLELVTSAMRKRGEGFSKVHRSTKPA